MGRLTRVTRAGVLGWVLACSAGGATMAAQQGALASAARASSKFNGFVWTIERDGQTGWLMGSLHPLTPDAYPLPPSMEAAFQSAQVLVQEADPDELKTPESAAELMRRAFYPAGDTLEAHVSAATYRTIVDRATKVGLPLEMLPRMRPWMVAVTLAAVEMQRSGFDPALGLDKHFRDRALGLGMPVQLLEKALDQISMLESLGPTLQDALVVETLEGASTEALQARALMAAWKAGDPNAIERILVDGMKDAPEVHRVLFVERNNRWVPKIEACLVKARCLVVVGAGHLVGQDGLIELLRRRGYRVEQAVSR
jgi:uncharacterized protein YbaP (TraB family)